MTTDTSAAKEPLQRVLMPRRGEPSDVRKLYFLPDQRSVRPLRWSDRTSVTIPAGEEVSFETYFNAFPAAYWRRWSQLDRVVLALDVEGEANLSLYRSKEDGQRISLGSHLLRSGHHEFELALRNFEDGGLLWFDVAAEEETTLADAAWCASQAPGPQELPGGGQWPAQEKKVAVGIPTFNRPADAVAALAALAEDPVVDALIDVVIMPDQGTAHPADEPGYAEATEHFGERFREVRQGNLGGSGGYSRIMYEALENADSPFILFMDDDIAIEPDSILRALQAARFAARPIIVGGQMLNLQERSQLRTSGERVSRSDFMWGPAPHAVYDHDFARYPLRAVGDAQSHRDPTKYDSRGLHRRVDVEYNGWWMCLFPRVVAERTGQPLPLFIKWDDTEYSLRAASRGFPTVTWPGAAVWHMAWADKDDAIDWQAYFHLRNRLIVAALYHDGDARGITRSIFKSTLKHTMCMEYSTMAIQVEAMRDFLAGPDHLFGILETSLPRINKIRAGYDDAVILPTAAQLPAPTGAPGVPTANVGGRLGKVKKIPWVLKSLWHLSRKEDPAHAQAPQLNLTASEARWFTLSRVDSATVSTAGGTGVAFRRRDRGLAKDLVGQTRGLLKEIEERFDELRGSYRAALPELSSRAAWREVFDAQ